MYDDMTESEPEEEEQIASESEMSDDDDLAVENDYMAEKYEACAALKDFAVHAEYVTFTIQTAKKNCNFLSD